MRYALVFDLGGVVVEFHAEQARKELLERFGVREVDVTSLSRNTFSGLVPSVTELALVGAIGTDEYLDAFASVCHPEVDRAALGRSRMGMVGGERRDVLSLMYRLARQHKVAVLTNTIALHWERLADRSRYSFWEVADAVFASHLMGVAKPFRGAFDSVLEGLGVGPDEAVFVDDTLANVSAARRY